MDFDLEKYRKIYKFARDITIKDAMHLYKLATKLKFASGELLINIGSLNRDVFFIRKGLVRNYIITDKGEEVTKMIRKEHELVVSHDIILFEQPCASYYQAIEDTSVFKIGFEKLEEVLSNNPKLEANRKFFFRKVMSQAIKRIDSFVLLTPEERYLQFVDENPDLLNRMPNKYIANVLGITPVSLSRIRSRLATKR